MPITVIGRPPKFHGKAVFQILSNLKNFGVGRIIVKSTFDRRYPEPSYFKIVKVEPEMDAENKEGKVWVENVFRGRHLGLQELTNAFQKDFVLIHKEDEDAHCNKPFTQIPERVLPSHAPLPPLLRMIVKNEMKAKGLSIDEEPQMKMIYADSIHRNRARVAKTGEKPNVKLMNHVSWELYDDSVLNPSKES